MEIKEVAGVRILIADYIGVDAAGKLNIIGGGWTICGVQPNGLTVPHYLAVLVDIPHGHLGEDFALEIVLHDLTTSQIVQVAGPTGSSEAMRISQLYKVDPPQAGPGVYVPSDMFSRVQAVIGFAGGIPLTPGHRYAWRAKIDGEDRGSETEFLVAGPPPAPVFGGPAGPASIPEF